MNTPPMLVHNGKHDPEVMRSGQIYCFLYDTLVPYNLPHMLVYSYRKGFRLIPLQVAQQLILTLRGKNNIHRNGEK